MFRTHLGGYELEQESRERILVCGTNAFNPMCRHYTTTSTTLVAESEVGGLTLEEEFSGKGFCPHDPRHNSTAIFSEGNLYAATAADFSGLDALIITKRLRTQQYDLKQLNRKHTYNESEFNGIRNKKKSAIHQFRSLFQVLTLLVQSRTTRTFSSSSASWP